MTKILGVVLAAVVTLGLATAPAQAAVHDSVYTTDPSRDVKRASEDITSVRYRHEIISGKHYLTVRITVRGKVKHGSHYYMDYMTPNKKWRQMTMHFRDFEEDRVLLYGVRPDGGGIYCTCKTKGQGTSVATARIPWARLNGTHTKGGPDWIKIGKTYTWKRDDVKALGYLW